jgi:integrase
VAEAVPDFQHGFGIGEAPTFAEMARLSVDRERRRREGLAGTTLRDRTKLLEKEDGPLLPLLGGLRVDAIGPETLQRWWEEEVEGRGRSVKTGRNYLNAINGVLRLAQRHGHLLIDRSRPRGGAETHTKSGRDRKVPLSRRLRFALAERYLRSGRPLLNERVFLRFDVSNFRKREWNELLRGARVGSVRPKDLRDTFASWLLTLGVPAPWVSEALGHADWAVTARHYARWIPGGDDEPLRRKPGEVYADLLARLAPFGAKSDATGRDGTTFPRDLEASFSAEPSRTRTPGPRATRGLRAQNTRT